jgi:hypothetical protein
MRCILGFFGTVRSLRYTAGSIRDSVVEPLRRAGIPVLRAGHFNLPDMIDNPRSGECGIVADRDETDLLDLDLRWIERQRHENIATTFEVGRAFPDAFGDGYRSLANLCQQLRSLERLWGLLRLIEPAPDDLVLLLRPDLFYLDKLDPVADLAALRDGRADCLVPDWQPWGGLNDRFAFCNRKAAEVYATRIRHFIDGCVALGGMHSEQFLQWVIRDHGLVVAPTGLRAVRVRANGQIAGNDATLLSGPAPVREATAA